MNKPIKLTEDNIDITSSEGGLGEAIPPRYTEYIFQHLPAFMKKYNVLVSRNTKQTECPTEDKS